MSPVLPARRPATARRARTLAAGSAALVTLAAVAALSACGSPAANPGGTSPSPTASSSSSSSSRPGSDCTSESILSALPGGATMVKFDCAKVGDTEWAAAEVDPGKTVFFLQRKDGTWTVADSDSVCGGASAGLPPSIMAYCPNPSASPS